MLTLTGASPASMAASIPSSTRATGKSMPFIAPKTASSSESRLTVTRWRPASASGPASARRAEPLVVRVRSSAPPSGRRMAASIAMRLGRSRRTSGSPPVIRSFSTPSDDERPGDPLDLLEGQDLVVRQERVVAPEDLLGHAVRAAEVAPVGDRDAQVADGSTEGIGRAGAAVEGRARCHRAHGSPERRTGPGRSRRPGRTAVRRGNARRYHRRRPSGTTSQLHHTDPRCHDALSRGRRIDPT